MNREVKLSLLSIVGIIFVIGTVFLLGSENSSYAILTATVAVILVAYAVIYYNESKDNYSLYNNKLRKILNTYDSVLVKSEKLPDLSNHSIIKVASMEDLVYAQMVIKKPIYFYEEEKHCSFVLIDDKEICVYILKANNEDVTSTDLIIEEIRNQPTTQKDIDHSILDDIENTTIIKLDNCKTYKVSPFKPQKSEYIKDITQVFEAINYQNAEIKEDLFIEIEPKKKKKKSEAKVNLTEVEEKIDELVELSNTKVLDIIELEPINTEAIEKIEKEKTKKKKPRRRAKKNNSKTDKKNETKEQ